MITLLMLKKNKVLVQDSISNASNILNSPVSGTVIDIKRTGEDVKYVVRTSLLNNFGLYFPLSSLITKCECVDNSYFIEFKNKMGVELQILLKSRFSFLPHLWVKVGDKGRVSSNMGFIPFGGLVEIITNRNCDQLVDVGSRVQAGSTPIAGIKDKE